MVHSIQLWVKWSLNNMNHYQITNTTWCMDEDNVQGTQSSLARIHWWKRDLHHPLHVNWQHTTDPKRPHHHVCQDCGGFLSTKQKSQPCLHHCQWKSHQLPLWTNNTNSWLVHIKDFMEQHPDHYQHVIHVRWHKKLSSQHTTWLTRIYEDKSITHTSWLHATRQPAQQRLK